MKRAHAPQQKAARREALLNAAARCFMRGGHRLPSAAEVARQAGVAKGTVYLYFRTKEAIFLGLLGHQLERLLAEIHRLDDEAALAGQLAGRILAFVRAEPSFLPLSALLQSVLEQNLDVATLSDFKQALASSLAETGDWLERRFTLPAGQGCRGLLHSYAAVLGIWQMVQWPATLADQADDPAFAPLRRDFDEEVRWALARIWS